MISPLHRALAGLAVGLAVVAASSLRSSAMERHLASRTAEDVYYLPPPGWLAVLSLGHREAMASAIYPAALVYFGRGFRTDVPTRYVLEYSDAMLHLDPEFRAVYRFTPTAVLYRRQPPTREEVGRVADIVREGARRFPADGEMAWNAGATLAYELGQFVPRAEAKAFEDEAQPHLARALELGAAPEWLALTTADKLTKLGQAERAAQQLASLLPTVDDESTRALMVERLRDLRAEADHEGLIQVLEDLTSRHAAELPFVPFDFYLVLGPGEVTEALPASPLDLLDGPRAGHQFR